MQKLIEKNNTALDGTKSKAIYSACEKYRYFLGRQWLQCVPPLVFIMLNPSTATELQNDPTVQRCETRARRGQYGGVQILNIFAYRATDPQDMRRQADPIGAANDTFLNRAIEQNAKNGRLICGWGTHGAHLGRADAVFKMIEAHGYIPLALKWTKDGHPQHPLYVGYDAVPCMKQRVQESA